MFLLGVERRQKAFVATCTMMYWCLYDESEIEYGRLTIAAREGKKKKEEGEEAVSLPQSTSEQLSSGRILK